MIKLFFPFSPYSGPRMQNNFMPENVYIPYFGALERLTGVEIGVASASGSVAMLDRMPNLTLYCIDPWRHFDGLEYEASHPQDEHEAGYENAKNGLQPYGIRVTILRKTSDEAVVDVPNDIDFVFVDGHHEYSQVFRDIKNYFQKIKLGGIIGGHDYRQVPDVTRAVNEIFKVNEIHTGEDFTWWVYKNG